MGMYNEVVCNCPHCGSTETIQVTQYVLGFGNFDIRQPESFLELNNEQLLDIKRELDRDYYCGKCDMPFNPLSTSRKSRLEKVKQILFGE